MNYSYLADFYRGWIIEVSPAEHGFVAVCYSPSRQRILVNTCYLQEFQAFNMARVLIDHHYARCQISEMLRELYEQDRLSLEELRSLNQSLSEAVV